MPRGARQVIPGVPHHITQRGLNHQQLFFIPHDYLTFLRFLRYRSREVGVPIYGYCLMPNHYHVVATPQTKNALSALFGKLAADYTRYLNTRRETTGHCWHERFFSCPMDDAHFANAMRYVEDNARRAALVVQPWDHPWSSARAHITGHDPYRLLAMRDWADRYPPDIWRELLKQPLELAIVEHLRYATQSGQWLR